MCECHGGQPGQFSQCDVSSYLSPIIFLTSLPNAPSALFAADSQPLCATWKVV